MFTGILTAISSNAAVGWIARRIPDWGGQLLGWLGALFALFTQLDPVTQSILITVLQGNWETVTLGSLVGVIVWAIGQWRSWKATVNPHVITKDKKNIRVELTEEEARQKVYEETGHYPTNKIEYR